MLLIYLFFLDLSTLEKTYYLFFGKDEEFNSSIFLHSPITDLFIYITFTFFQWFTLY